MNIEKIRRSLLLFITIVFLALTALTMSACSEAGANVSRDLSNYPESVQDGTVSAEYYEQISSFYKDMRPVIDIVGGLLDEQKEKSDLIYNEEYVSKLSVVLTGLDDILPTYNVSPKTKVDKEVHVQLDKVIQLQMQLNGLEANYLKKKNHSIEIELSFALIAVRSVMEGLDNIVYEYGLIEE